MADSPEEGITNERSPEETSPEEGSPEEESPEEASPEERSPERLINLAPVYNGWDSVPSMDKLCAVCKEINIEGLLESTGYPLHANLMHLSESARDCVVCYKTCTQIDGFRERYRYKDRPPWKGPPTYEYYQARLVFPSTFYPKCAAMIVLSPFDAPLERRIKLSEIDDPIGYDYSSEDGLFIPHWDLKTIVGDPAEYKGVQSVRPLPESNSHVISTQHCQIWLNECFASVESDDCLHKHDDVIRDTILSMRPIPGRWGADLANFFTWKSSQPSICLHNVTERPARLVEIMKPLDGHAIGDVHSTILGLRLLASPNFKVPYTTLSYRWGNLAASWNTMKANLAARQVGFTLEELPATLRDAVEATARLGIRYIWIDSICIVQDDREDWAVEAVKMTSIYQESLVTLAADNSVSSDAGLFNEKSEGVLRPGHYIEITNTLSTGEKSTLFLIPKRPNPNERSTNLQTMGDLFTDSALTARGWTLQERILSPRIIHFAKDQLYWECHHGYHCSEDDYWHIGSRDTHSKIDRRVKAAETEEEKRQIVLDWWYSVVADDYSRRELTYSSDKLVAINGFAKMLSKMTPMTYLDGLWEEDVIKGLCWSRNSKGKKSAETGRGPSWSWATQDSHIEYFSAINKPPVAAECLGVECVPEVEHIVDKDGNPVELNTEGWIMLKAKVQRAIVLARQGFDNSDWKPWGPGISLPSATMKHDLLLLPNGQYCDCAALDSDDSGDYENDGIAPPVYAVMLAQGSDGDSAGACLIVKEISEENQWYERIGFAESISIGKDYADILDWQSPRGLLHEVEEWEVTVI